MDNEFFNFDTVIEIEKKKSYNQALEELCNKLCSNGTIADFMKDYIREKAKELMK